MLWRRRHLYARSVHDILKPAIIRNCYPHKTASFPRPSSRIFTTTRIARDDCATTLIAPNGHSWSQPSGLFIRNEFVKSPSGETLESIDPATERPIISLHAAQSSDVDNAVNIAHETFENTSWRDVDPTVRRDLLLRLANLVSDHAHTLATIETWDNGKPFSTALHEDIPDVIATLRYYAGWADKLNGSSFNLGPAKMAYTTREPVGVCGLITPFNYPLCSAVWKLAPALAAGNTVVVKPSEHTSLSTLYLAHLTRLAGFPAGVISVLPGLGDRAGAALVSHPLVAKVAFTGSTSTAQSVMRFASGSLKRLTLETGGKSPLVVFEDADIEQAAKWAYAGVMSNAGQICTSTARMLVHERVHDHFVDKLVEYTKQNSVVGSPWHAETTQGPQTTRVQYERILSMIETGRNEGAKLAYQGPQHRSKSGSGFFIPPIIFTSIPDISLLAQEEIFGPIAVVCTPFTTDDEAVHRANNTRYGLGASIFTKDIARAHQVARRIKAGMVWINSSQDCDPRVPFGGVKMSGAGSELGEEGIKAYTVEKAIHINLGMRL